MISSGMSLGQLADTGFDVGDGDFELGCGERPGDGGVGVAVDEDHVRLFLQEKGLELDEDIGGLSAGVASGADAEKTVGLLHVQFLEEDVGHVGAVVLSGVDEDVPPRVPSADFGPDDGFFDELRAGSYKGDDFFMRFSCIKARDEILH